MERDSISRSAAMLNVSPVKTGSELESGIMRIRCSVQSSMTIVNRACAIRSASWRLRHRFQVGYMERDSISRSAAMLNVSPVKTGSEFVTSLNLCVFKLSRADSEK